MESGAFSCRKNCGRKQGQNHYCCSRCKHTDGNSHSHWCVFDCASCNEPCLQNRGKRLNGRLYCCGHCSDGRGHGQNCSVLGRSAEHSTERTVRPRAESPPTRNVRPRPNLPAETAQKCIICVDAPLELCNQPCGHICFCRNCGEELVARICNRPCRNFQELCRCPICRKQVNALQRIFFS